MERIELPEAGQHRVLETLQIWKHELPDTRSAVLPPNTQNPNPLVIADSVVASVFSPGAICSVDKESGRLQWVHRLDGYGGTGVFRPGGRVVGKCRAAGYPPRLACGRAHADVLPPSPAQDSTYTFPPNLLLCGVF